ncbi:biotin--[acetyl-CoA-carboxylase] ligase [Actinomadura craniellae]|uniref:biotin--[biotin carboxyl-carrier protein] ligase n=1 Tax=Actinomadura craniellae TaxID=2231787 RepID=A0A365GZ88_9ACTN|nr:biotin--[acetyl-CoA-carboxylase] ligase [Actinomadura craniellae]RAY12155.1 biotin--[acetyl-CoA-carboxylase] ligase [Actinomadura craniellae]
MTDSPYADLDRPPLNERTLTRALVRPGTLWREIRVVRRTGSTNADLAAAALTGAPEGTILVAEEQTAGRGRLGRTWAAPPRSGLLFSILLRPEVPVARQGWIPLLTGVAVATAVRRMSARAQAGDFGEPVPGEQVDARLKWPNDVLVGERKLAGVLAERAGDAVVVGVGLNVVLRAAELPVPTATSLAIEHSATTDRELLLRAVLRGFDTGYRDWTAAGGDPEASGLAATYRGLCATLGREVQVHLPGDRTLTGVATDIDPAGCLIVADEIISAGDVVHVR